MTSAEEVGIMKWGHKRYLRPPSHDPAFCGLYITPCFHEPTLPSSLLSRRNGSSRLIGSLPRVGGSETQCFIGQGKTGKTRKGLGWPLRSVRVEYGQ